MRHVLQTSMTNKGISPGFHSDIALFLKNGGMRTTAPAPGAGHLTAASPLLKSSREANHRSVLAQEKLPDQKDRGGWWLSTPSVETRSVAER